MGEEGIACVSRGSTVAISARLNRGEPLANRILRVDHGGENGAVNIYKAQTLVCEWRAPDLVEELKSFRAHEERHRELFGAELSARRVRQGLGYRFCGFGGYFLGLMTAMMGRSAVAATTCAIERVVLRHLREQMEYLREADQKAFSIVSSIVAEEEMHHDQALKELRRGGFWPVVVDPVVAAATEFVIWIGMHR
jgi:ubiquinone biosynthesis monooxygenase Coq7